MKRISLLLVTILMLLAMPLITRAESETGYYVRLSCLNNDISGDFDDGRYYISEDAEFPQIVFIPKLEQATGFGITIGGYRGRLSGEVSYFFSEHDSAIYYGGWHHVNTSHELFALDVKYAFIGEPADRMSFYGMVGVGLPRFKVKDGVWDPDGSLWRDESLSGLMYSLGVGCSVRLNSKITLDMNYVARRIDINSVDTSGLHFKPVDDLRVIERTVLIGMNYDF